ncbi:MAG: type I methionyl aminopeptidase, partial [Candidatus Limnocylindria bacterium]
MKGSGTATIKRPAEIDRMRGAGAILAGILEVLRVELRPGVSTGELDAIAERMIRDAGAVPSFKGYGSNPPFAGSICASINDEVVHGIPSPHRRLADGDLISVDIGCILEGWHADCARTWAVGRVPRATSDLIEATRSGMEAGIAAAVAGHRIGDIGHAIETVARRHGYGVVRPFVGHGIGQQMHEEPQVPNYGRPGTGLLIEPGMCFAIEPMYNLGGDDVFVEDDGWTVRTSDGSLSAHFENTI